MYLGNPNLGQHPDAISTILGDVEIEWQDRAFPGNISQRPPGKWPNQMHERSRDLDVDTLESCIEQSLPRWEALRGGWWYIGGEAFDADALVQLKIVGDGPPDDGGDPLSLAESWNRLLGDSVLLER